MARRTIEQLTPPGATPRQRLDNFIALRRYALDPVNAIKIASEYVTASLITPGTSSIRLQPEPQSGSISLDDNSQVDELSLRLTDPDSPLSSPYSVRMSLQRLDVSGEKIPSIVITKPSDQGLISAILPDINPGLYRKITAITLLHLAPSLIGSGVKTGDEGLEIIGLLTEHIVNATNPDTSITP